MEEHLNSSETTTFTSPLVMFPGDNVSLFLSTPAQAALFQELCKSEESKIFKTSYFFSLDCLFNCICRNDGVPEFRKPEVGEVAEVQEEAPAGTVIYQVRGPDDRLEDRRKS